MVSRTDIIGQNGNTGEHYKVEEVARMIATYLESDEWVAWVPLTIAILEYVEEYDNEH